MAWRDDELVSDINPLCAYHKWRLRDGSLNPKVDEVSRHLLNLKDGPVHPKFNDAVLFFSRKLVTALRLLETHQYPNFAVIVPSSTKDKSSPGLAQILEASTVAIRSKNISISVLNECLIRHTTVQKSSTGGRRSMQKHFSSIKVSGQKFKASDRILLLDDVATTGNTLRACKEILNRAGAGNVIMLALCQTASEDE